MRVPVKSFRWFGVAAALLVLAGCLNSANKYTGSGPITLSFRVKTAFNEYMKLQAPGAFAVTLDGTGFGGRYCANINCTSENSVRAAVESCEQRNRRPCKLYADGRNVVWQVNAPNIVLPSATNKQLSGPNKILLPPRTIADISSLVASYGDINRSVVSEANDVLGRAKPKFIISASEAKFHRDRAIAFKDLGRYNDSILEVQTAIKLLKNAKFGVPVGAEMRAFSQLGMLQMFAGRLSDSLKSLKISQAALPEEWGTKAHLHIVNNGQIAMLKALLGQIGEAEKYLLAAEHDRQYWDEHQGQGHKWTVKRAGVIISAKGLIELANGRFEEAEIMFSTAVKLVSNNSHWKDRIEVPLHRMLLAEAQFLAGNLIKAEVSTRQSLFELVGVRGRSSPQVGWALSLLAAIMTEQNRPKEAEKVAGLAINLFDQLGIPTNSILFTVARLRLANSLMLLNKPNQAYDLYSAMQSKADGNIGFADNILDREINFAVSAYLSGVSDKALTLLEQRQNTITKVFGKSSYEYSEFLAMRAILRHEAGQMDRAQRDFDTALPILLNFSSYRSNNSASKAHRRSLILNRYLELTKAVGERNSRQIFFATQVGANSSVQRYLSKGTARLTISDPQLAEYASNLRDIEQNVAALEFQLKNVFKDSSLKNAKVLTNRFGGKIRRLRSLENVILAKLQTQFPHYAGLVNPKPISVKRVQALLRNGEAMISTYVAKNQTYIWAIPKLGRAVFHTAPVGKRQLDSIVDLLRTSLDPQAQNISDIPEFNIAASHQLFKLLLEPVQAGWKNAKSLLIVPHGALGRLPFSVLVTAPAKMRANDGVLFSNYRHVPWLARSHAVTLLPSVTSLVSLRSSSGPKVVRKPFIGFGDPIFSIEQADSRIRVTNVAKVGQNETSGRLNVRGIPIEIGNAPRTRQLDSARLSILPRLIDTAEEIRSISRTLNADIINDVFIGARATEHAVKTATLSDYKVIVFATHGLVPGDLDGLDEPALAFSSPLLGNTEGDGVLTTSEILNLRLNADWVVLSACNTGAANGLGAEAFSGLGRAFFYAGTKAVLLSNWPVETTSSKLLITSIFRRQAKISNLSRSRALHLAKLSLIDEEIFVDKLSGKILYSYAHPIFWAPFVVVGEGG
ncbi:MAG: CHAT domain-containing protein [Rhodospirillales bacterium]|nr:CHAT domain-containing protein [Rhodospirillales bacterium]